MKSKDCLDLLMFNQKKVKNGFEFINLKTKERATIENCYEIIKKDLEILEILKRMFNYKSIQKFIEDMSKEEWFKIEEWHNRTEEALGYQEND